MLKIRRSIITVFSVLAAVFLLFVLYPQADDIANSTPAETAAMPHDLMQAVTDNDYAAVGYLLNQQHNVNMPAASGETPLMRAAALGYCNIAAALLKHGADGTLCDKLGNHALYLAAAADDTEMIRVLLQYKVSINTGSEQDRTALLAACWHGKNGALELLLQHDPLLYPGCSKGKGPIMSAMKNNHVKSAQILLAHGVSPRELDENNNTVLHWAVRIGSAELTELLIRKYHLDPRELNKDGESALDIARRKGDSKLVKMLEKSI